MKDTGATFVLLPMGIIRGMLDQARHRPEGLTPLERWLSLVVLVRGSGAQGDVLAPRNMVQGMLEEIGGRAPTQVESLVARTGGACG